MIIVVKAFKPHIFLYDFSYSQIITRSEYHINSKYVNANFEIVHTLSSKSLYAREELQTHWLVIFVIAVNHR